MAGRRQPSAGRCRRRAAGRWRTAGLLLAAAGVDAAEARHGAIDALVLLQRDIHKEPPLQKDVLSLDLKPLRLPLGIMRGAMENAMENLTTGRDIDLNKLFPGDFSGLFPGSFSGATGEVSIVEASDSLLSSTERIMWFVQKIFDTATTKEMNSVLEAANNMEMSLNTYRERLRDRAQDFKREIQRVKQEDMIPMMAAFMSKEVRALRPVIRENVREFLRLLRHVDWGEGSSIKRMQLFMMEPAIVSGAAQICQPISTLLQDYDDLTERGFCRIVSPVIRGISSTNLLEKFSTQLHLRQEEMLAMQSVTTPPTAEELEAPAILDVTQRLADTAGSLVDVGMDAAHVLNSTVGEVLRNRLRCSELLSSSAALPVANVGLVALGLALASAWRAAA